MTSTRLATTIFVLAGSAGLALVALSSEPLQVVGGALLLTVSAVFLIRHFWREGGVKREREHRAHSTALSQALDQIRRESESATTSAQESLSDLGSRFDAFATGILEHIAQVGLDTSDLRLVLEEGRGRLVEVESQISAIKRDLEAAERVASKHREALLSQMTGVLGLYFTLRPRFPYPTFGGWAISGDCAQRLVSLILTTRPKWILEAGSGLSTLLAAQALDLLGEDGKIISLEHEREWLENTEALLLQHEAKSRVTLVESPLVEVEINNELFSWYDLEAITLPEGIDLVFIDGPPKATGSLARYPALPLLHERLTQSAVVLMDDASRPDEREAVRRWQSELPGLETIFRSDAKGSVEIRRTAT